MVVDGISIIWYAYIKEQQMYTIGNVRMAKSMFPHGVRMNGCKAVGVMYADVIDADSQAIIYSGTVDMCRGKIEMME